jgi:hypothetical protein
MGDERGGGGAFAAVVVSAVSAAIVHLAIRVTPVIVGEKDKADYEDGEQGDGQQRDANQARSTSLGQLKFNVPPPPTARQASRVVGGKVAGSDNMDQLLSPTNPIPLRPQVAATTQDPSSFTVGL